MNKQIFSTVLALLFSLSAHAIPTLQLYSDAATYDAGSQTWVVNTSSFTLTTLAINEGKAKAKANGKGSIALTDTTEVFLSVALDPSALPGDGTISIDGVDVTGYFFGTPPIGVDTTPPNSDELAPHGVFDTYFAEFSFLLGSGCTACVQDQQPGADSARKDGWVNSFNVVISGYDLIHFDLYTKTTDSQGFTSIDHFAPFSHDAEYSVAEPASLALLGLSLFGMGMLARRKSS